MNGRDAHLLTIRAPDGVPQNAQFLLDGKPIKGLCNLTLRIEPNALITVTMTLEPGSVDVDAVLVERVLVSPPKLTGAGK